MSRIHSLVQNHPSTQDPKITKKLRSASFLLIISLSLLLLSSCSYIQQGQNYMASGDPIYECRVSATCGDETNRVHYCQIRFDIDTSEMPEFCYDYCVDRSEFDLKSSCVKVELAESSYNSESLGSTPILKTSWVEADESDSEGNSWFANTFGTDDETDKGTASDGALNNNLEFCSQIKDFTCPTSCTTTNDFDCCIYDDKCWFNGQCTSCQETECQFDSDCKDTCENNEVAKRYCDLETGSCVTQRVEACPASIVQGTTVQQVCNNGTCSLNKADLEARRVVLIQEGIELVNGYQKIGQLRLKFENQCRAQVADISGKFITESALLVNPSIMKILSKPGGLLVDYLLQQAGQEKARLMTPEEQLVWTCQQVKTLDDEYESLDDRVAANKESISEIDNLLSSLS